MPTAELETQTETGQGGSEIDCEAYYDGGIPCGDRATWWLEVHLMNDIVKMIPVCAHHAQDWAQYAAEHNISPDLWSIYPMR